mgnify:CR=1 FL=1|jgi:hypothetical protein|tara:strand:+ start:163 stop:336 length:174 start_codon:yes stop_codon:yes gene_type:complete
MSIKDITSQDIASFIEISPRDSLKMLAECINNNEDISKLIINGIKGGKYEYKRIERL